MIELNEIAKKRLKQIESLSDSEVYLLLAQEVESLRSEINQLNDQLPQSSATMQQLTVEVNLLAKELNNLKSTILAQTKNRRNNSVIRSFRKYQRNTTIRVRNPLKISANNFRKWNRKLRAKYQAKLLKSEIKFHKARLLRAEVKYQQVNGLLPFAENKTIEESSTNHNRHISVSDEQSIRECAMAISIPSSDEPVISIIVPVYENINYTLSCLDSIQVYEPKIPFEVIVVDDCSPDNSVRFIKLVQGIRVLEQPSNQGFIGTCNFGAQKAKGEYLCFLNNDTRVLPDWLDELHRTFTEFPGTGLAGSKLVYPDGTLQEAGGIIWKDGSGCNYGRNDNPELPAYNYARQVDYCSGASLMIPNKLFHELGGFNLRYKPAYCEDSDLAFEVRKAGYRVMYQPLSALIHYEGVSCGTDENSGIKAYQVSNTKKLYEKWRKDLMDHDPSGTNLLDAKDRHSLRRVLVLDHCTPTPDQDAGSLTTINSMLILREMGFQVTFIPEENFQYDPKYTRTLQRFGIEALYSPYVNTVKEHLAEFGERYDLVFLFRPMVVERHLSQVRKYCPTAKVLFHTVDLHFLRMERQLELTYDPKLEIKTKKMRECELRAIKNSDLTIVHSTAEETLLKNLVPDAPLFTFPLILNVEGGKKSFHERKDLAFVGGYRHEPNVDAVHYFVKEVMPILRKKLPNVKFHIIGSHVPKSVQKLADDDIEVIGFVEELGSYLANIRLSVAPLRYGAGIKGKVGNAMAIGLPVIASQIAVEGMALDDGKHLMVANTPEDFAKAIVKLYSNEELWNRIRTEALLTAEEYWGVSAAWNLFQDILTKLDMPLTNAKYPLSSYKEIQAETNAKTSVEAI